VSRRVWKAVETEAGKVRIAEAKRKRRRKRRNKKRENRKRKKKTKKEKTIEVKIVAEEWEIWDKEEEVGKSEEEAKKLVS